jgi:hypothetical protein
MVRKCLRIWLAQAAVQRSANILKKSLSATTGTARLRLNSNSGGPSFGSFRQK